MRRPLVWLLPHLFNIFAFSELPPLVISYPPFCRCVSLSLTPFVETPRPPFSSYPFHSTQYFPQTPSLSLSLALSRLYTRLYDTATYIPILQRVGHTTGPGTKTFLAFAVDQEKKKLSTRSLSRPGPGVAALRWLIACQGLPGPSKRAGKCDVDGRLLPDNASQPKFEANMEDFRGSLRTQEGMPCGSNQFMVSYGICFGL